MKLIDLVPEIAAPAPRALALSEISAITQDSRDIASGSLFFAIEGAAHDGHDFVLNALKSGATAAVVQRGHPKAQTLLGPRVLEVADTRQALAVAASRFYGNPSHRLRVCGITGTNGKTTSTYLIESILKEAGEKPAVIGTIENRFGDEREPASRTTPDAISLQKLLDRFEKRGAKSAVIEVTSHALDQKRTGGMTFAAALFTNLTQDHLDYHSSLEDYFAAKARLFLDYPVGVRAIHADDPFGARLANLCREKGHDIILFGKEGHDVDYAPLRLASSGIKGHLKTKNGPIAIDSPLVGSFNAQNLAGAAAVALGLNIDLQIISKALSHGKGVPGRMQAVPNKRGVTVIVDYAHTPDALEKALKTLRAISSGQLICVFGCGGDRDATKRPIMGAIAESQADKVILTSDNPRSEDPEAIIAAIQRGFKNPSQVERISDRALAIRAAIKMLKPGDTLLIAGKGHENYQIIGSRSLPFDDFTIALEDLKS